MEKTTKYSKWRVYHYKEDKTNKHAYVLARSESMALLKLKQLAKYDLKLIESKPIEELESTKAYLLFNQITPF